MGVTVKTRRACRDTKTKGREAGGREQMKLAITADAVAVKLTVGASILALAAGAAQDADSLLADWGLDVQARAYNRDSVERSLLGLSGALVGCRTGLPVSPYVEVGSCLMPLLDQNSGCINDSIVDSTLGGSLLQVFWARSLARTLLLLAFRLGNHC